MEKWKTLERVRYAMSTCKGYRRERNMMFSDEGYDGYVLYYDVIGNEFWSDVTMRKKYKRNVEDRIKARAARSVEVKKYVPEAYIRPLPWLDYLLLETLPEYEIKDLIYRCVPWALFDEGAKEAIEAGVPIEDIIA